MSGAGGDDPHDVQEMTGADTRVYEAVAARAVTDEAPTADDVAGMVEMADLGEDAVRHSLDVLVGQGWLTARAGRYALGPHDWEVDY